MFLPYIITQLITVWAFSSHHCVFFVFRLAFRAFSSFSSSVVPPLTQLHPSSLTQLTQLISYNSSHLTTHTTHLAQPNSHNSSHSTHLTQFNSLKSCFRVAFGGAAFVSSHSTLPKFSYTTHLTTHTTPLISQLTQLISHNSCRTTQGGPGSFLAISIRFFTF